MTNGAMLADVSWSLPFNVTGLKLPTVGSPLPGSNAGGSAGAGLAAVTASRRRRDRDSDDPGSRGHV